MGLPPPWHAGLIDYQINYWCCTGDCPNNGNWNIAACNENAAIRITLYSDSSSWQENLENCWYKDSNGIARKMVPDGVNYNFNLFEATSCITGGVYAQDGHAMVAKLPFGIDPSNQSFTNFTFFQYNNFQARPGISDPNSNPPFVQMGIPTISQPNNIIKIYQINSIYLDPDTGSIRFDRTLVRQFSIDCNGVVDSLPL